MTGNYDLCETGGKNSASKCGKPQAAMIAPGKFVKNNGRTSVQRKSKKTTNYCTKILRNKKIFVSICIWYISFIMF